MTSAAIKMAMTKASGIWLILAGVAITTYGLFNLGSFMVAWGFSNSYTSVDHMFLALSPSVIPGVLLVFAGYSLMLKKKWWLAVICLVALGAASLLVAFLGVSWYLAGAAAVCSLAAAALLIVSKEVFK